MSTRAGIALLCAVLSGPAPVAAGQSAPALESIASLEAHEAIPWTLKTDTGLLVVYADGGVHVFDLLDGGKRFGKPVLLPGAEKRGNAVQVSGTNLLLITSADGGLQEADAAEAVPPKRSYAINLMSGNVLWNAESFAPPVQTFLFPKDGVLVVRSGRQGDEFAAFEVATGRKLWSSQLQARYAGRRGGLLEVLGEDSGMIDPHSGQRRWAFSLPSMGRHPVLVSPARDRLMVWKGNNFKGFAVPAPGTPGSGAELPETVAPRLIWKFAAEDSMPSRCVFMGSCWAQVVSGDRVLVVSKRHVEMLDAATGKVVWDRRKNGVWRAFPISSSGKIGAEVGWGELVFVDVANGKDMFHLDAPAPVGGKERNHTAQWLDEDELLVVYYDNAWRPRDMARYD
ncbi:MAG TPA: PQQ-binding-like beta-propeller repeat protein, partial [Candidatus Polarisedimenticolia bacterium]|nr:PQQ-binding-like beta-propeller repeat protein [Candidatus Polarisedimenticolia bacterium]